MATKEYKQLVTKKDIVDGLKRIGLKPGMIVEVHGSLSSFGYVIGGAQTVVDALMEVITPAGTIVMAYQTVENSEPSRWRNPPINPMANQKVRDNIPAYNRFSSDSIGMGKIAANFRKRPNIIMSNHPQLSYMVWGQYAKALCNRQSLHFPLSQESPAARMYELKACILLMGCDYDVATMMHLAEYRTACRPVIIEGSKVEADGVETWKKYLDVELDSSIFKNVGKVMEDKRLVAVNKIGDSVIKLFRGDIAVDEATAYFEKFIPYDSYR